MWIDFHHVSKTVNMEEFRHFVYYAVMLGSHQCTVAEAEQCVIGIMSETRDVSIVPGRPHS